MEDLNPLPDEEGGNLYLINGNMCKLADAGIFARNEQNYNEQTQEEKPPENRKRGKR